MVLETWLFWWLATQYRTGGKRWRDRVGWLILRTVISEWHVLLTNFGSPTTKAQIEVDVLSTDGILYQGGLRDYFFNTDGELAGLLLSNAARYDRIQYEAHKPADFEAKVKNWPAEPAHKFTRDRARYWRLIPGADLFYIPRERIANVNVRHVTAPADVPKATEERLINRNIVGFAITEQPQMYWLHIKAEPPNTYVLIKTNAPRLTGEGGPAATVRFNGWAELATTLADCGIPVEEVNRAQVRA